MIRDEAWPHVTKSLIEEVGFPKDERKMKGECFDRGTEIPVPIISVKTTLASGSFHII